MARLPCRNFGKCQDFTHSISLASKHRAILHCKNIIGKIRKMQLLDKMLLEVVFF